MIVHMIVHVVEMIVCYHGLRGGFYYVGGLGQPCTLGSLVSTCATAGVHDAFAGASLCFIYRCSVCVSRLLNIFAQG